MTWIQIPLAPCRRWRGTFRLLCVSAPAIRSVFKVRAKSHPAAHRQAGDGYSHDGSSRPRQQFAGAHQVHVLALQQPQLLQRHQQLRAEDIGLVLMDVVHHGELQLVWLLADFLQQLPPQRLLRRFAVIEEPAKKSPVVRRRIVQVSSSLSAMDALRARIHSWSIAVADHHR